MDAEVATLKRRDTGEEIQVSMAALVEETQQLLQTIQNDLLQKSRRLNQEQTREANSYEEFKNIMKEHKGFIKVHWKDNPENEAKIKQETKAVSRCKLDETSPGKDFLTGEATDDLWLFAQSY